VTSRKRGAGRVLFSLGTLLLSVICAGVGCTEEEPYDGPRDECKGESGGCGGPLLTFAYSDDLPVGTYEVSFEMPEATLRCTMIQEVNTDDSYRDFNIEIECDDPDVHVSPEQYAISLHDLLPETVTLTIERTENGCPLTEAFTPLYVATWFICDRTCIDGRVKLDVSKLRSDSCDDGAGGAGGSP
jgi:hypothetical protein